ncbi:MAG: hypothetical protein ABR584_05430 [Candidatus Baltobacteraceae bacterium]
MQKQLRVATIFSLLTLTACSAGPSPGVLLPGPRDKGLGGTAGGSWTLTIQNDSQSVGGGGYPITAFFDTNCIYDGPPWSYTIQPGGNSISYALNGISESGSCFFDPSNGTVTISFPNGQPNDVVTFNWTYWYGSKALVINCGQTGTSPNTAINSSWTYDYVVSTQSGGLANCSYN